MVLVLWPLLSVLLRHERNAPLLFVSIIGGTGSLAPQPKKAGPIQVVDTELRRDRAGDATQPPPTVVVERFEVQEEVTT